MSLTSLSLPCQQPVERHGSGQDVPGIYCTVGQEIFLTSRTFCMLWGPPSLLFNGYWGSLPGVRRPGRQVNHWPSFNAKVKNKWGYTHTSLYPFMTWTGTTLPVSLPLDFPHTVVSCFKVYWPTLILHVFLLFPHVLHALPISLTW